MTVPRSVTVGTARVALVDGVERLGPLAGIDVVVCAEPATLHVARRLLRASPRLVVLSDAGVGKDRAGVAGLERLADVGVAAVAVRHDSARIGDADDLLANGAIGHVNAAAARLGVREGPLKPQLERLFARAGTEPATGQQVA